MSDWQMSPKALEIAEKKGRGWEYELTGVLLKDWISPIAKRQSDLRAGLYSPAKKRVPDDEFFHWMSDKMSTLAEQTSALNLLINNELPSSWGEPGQPGSVEDITWVCEYIAGACSRILEWEEEVRSTKVGDDFQEMLQVTKEAPGDNIVEMLKLPKKIDEVIAADFKGNFDISLVLALPDGWEERSDAALEKIKAKFGIDSDD